jgi:TolB-like protein/class 3 adenylate cyclase
MRHFEEIAMERKLAAILAADVVGYSALMETDEAGTFDRMKAGREELFEPEIKKHHGRIFKLMGDGLLAEFGSVVDAVECAVTLQRGMMERNASVSEGKRIEVRIGINLGEVIVDGEDRYGEGVNVAARLQQLADPGGICVSGKVSKEVEKKLAFGFEPMGEQKVKNIAEPISVFKVRVDGVPILKPPQHGQSFIGRRAFVGAALIGLLVVAVSFAGWNWFFHPDSNVPAARASIAVLPFDSLSDDKEQAYVADGLTEDLTTELARIPDLFVISRNAAFTYKGKSLKSAQIGKELRVRYILEGSIRRAGDDLRINAQLIDAVTNGHLWAQRFDGRWSEVFELQDKIVEQISAALKLRLVTSQRASQIAGGTSNPAAYEAFLRGRELERSESAEDWGKAAKYLEQALALDPKFGSAAAELAWIYQAAVWESSKAAALGVTQDEARVKATAYVDEAAKHPSPVYYQLLSDKLVFQQKSDEAIVAGERAIALDASDPDSYLQMSFALIFNGRATDGLGFLNAAMRVDPGWSLWRHYIAGLAYFSMDRLNEAVAALEKIDHRSKDASYWEFWVKYNGLKLLISAYGHLERNDDIAKAKEQIKPYMVRAEDREFTGLLAMGEFPFKNYADVERLLEGLHKAGIPEVPFGFDLKSKDRLSGSSIKELLFGHRVEGRRVETGEAYSRTTTPDGTGSVTVGAWSDKGVSQIEGNTMCTFFPSQYRVCSAVFRNPNGTFTQKNEYLAVNPRWRFEYSVVN